MYTLETCTRENPLPSCDYREPTPKKATQAELARPSTRSFSHSLWTDYFKDPSQWWDNRTSKLNSGSPDFNHKITKESLRIHGWHNPCWVQEELRKVGLRPIKVEVEGLNVEKKRKVYGVHHHDKRGKSQSDTIESISIVALLKACAKKKDLCEGSKIHTAIAEKGLLKTNVFVGNTLVNMYAKCGALEKAQAVFDELPVWTVVSWNALIAGYSQEGLGEEAFNCLEQMQLEGFSPNAVTFSCVVNACGIIGSVYKGQEFHAEIVKHGFMEEGTVVGTVLVDMYANCGMLAEAQEVFNSLLVRDVVSWTALIAGYVQHGDGKQALACYERLHIEGCSPNAVTYSCILKACGIIGALDKGQDIHTKITKEGLLDKDIVIANALVDMYAKCGLLGKAKEVFDELQDRDLVSWTALITGYALYGFGDEALICFKEMQHDGFSPDAVTFSCIVKACGSIGAVYQGQEIHFEIVRDEFLETNRVVGTALVDMYANCGMLAEAQDVFYKMPIRDVIAWTALMEGYAQLGKDEIVFSSFDKMIGEGSEPNSITFTIVLNSCCHRGLLEKGEIYFEMVCKGYDRVPTLEHHTCMVDLFGRAGQLDKAIAVMEEMPYSANLMMWHTLICACRNRRIMELGDWAFKHATQLDGKDPSTYVCVSNLYAGAGSNEEDTDRSEAMRVRHQSWRRHGLSWEE